MTSLLNNIVLPLDIERISLLTDLQIPCVTKKTVHKSLVSMRNFSFPLQKNGRDNIFIGVEHQSHITNVTYTIGNLTDTWEISGKLVDRFNTQIWQICSPFLPLSVLEYDNTITVNIQITGPELKSTYQGYYGIIDDSEVKRYHQFEFDDFHILCGFFYKPETQ